MGREGAEGGGVKWEWWVVVEERRK